MVTQEVLALSGPALAGLVAVFLLAGVVKGVVGIGMPLVVVPLSAQFVDLRVAVALLTVPLIATNIGQAREGGHTMSTIRQLLPMLATLVLGIFVGVHLLTTLDRHLLNAALGISFIALAALLMSLPRFRLSPRTDRWAGPLVGLCAGLLGGMAAMFGPPLVAYLVGSGAAPDTFVKRMAIVAFVGSATLLIALGRSGSLSGTDLLVSAAAILPIQLGMPAGRWLRRRIKPAVFRAGVLVALALGGLDLLHRAWGG